MALTIKKETLNQLLFFICISIPLFRDYEPVFAIWSIAILITLQRTYSKEVISYLIPFILIVLFASIVGLFRDHKTYEIIRDFTYLLKPILGLLLGYQFFNSKFETPLKTVIYGGVFVAIGHLLAILNGIIFLNVRSIEMIRYNGGYFSDFEIYCLILLIFHKKFSLGLTRKQLTSFTILMAISGFLYFARTHFILFGILFFGLKGYFVPTRKAIIISITCVVCGLASYAVIYSYNPQRQSKGIESFLYKIKNAPIEPFKTKVNVDDWKDFNDNYRSYENIRTITQMINGGTATIVFGKGLGSSVDLKREVWLQSSLMRYIPVLHNAFMTVFLKTGLLGIVMLLFSIVVFFRNKRKDSPVLVHINYFFIASGIYMVISYWVSLGFYFVPDGKSIIIGFMLAYKNDKIKKALYNHERTVSQ